MKSKIFLLIIIFFVLNKINAQSYEPIVDTNNKIWVVFRSEDHPPYHGKTLAYKISDDSVLIDNEYWHKVLEADDSLYSQWFLSGYIREKNKVVFLKGGCFDTLYNFNFSPGDTCFSAGCLYIIKDTTTIFFAGKNRNAQVIDYESDTLYSGAGSKKGGLLGPEYYCLTGAIYTLVCYYENDSLLYHNPDYESCYIDNITSTGKFWLDHEIKVYPNPTGHSVFLRFARKLSQPFDFILYNASGSMVKQIRLTRRVTEIDLEDLNSGLYFYELKGLNRAGRTTGKIVIK